MKFLYFLFILFISVGCNQKYYTYEASEPSQNYKPSWEKNSPSTQGMPSEPGKCYAKCLIPDRHENIEHEIYLYTGDEFDQQNVQYVRKEIKPASTKWVKKKADKNCLSANPEDCLVWCLQESPAVYEEYYEVLDTNLIKDFDTKLYEVTELVEPGGFTEWIEVICNNDLSNSVVAKIHAELYSLGYELSDKAPTKINKKMKAALTKYQKDNQLPIGQLDIHTLEALGINF